MPELRRDPVSGRWVIFSPERRRRPSDYKYMSEQDPATSPFAYGNEHLTPPEVFAVRPDGSAPDGPGWALRVVPNRYPALRIEGDVKCDPHGVYDRLGGVGAHEVVIETPEPRLALEDQPLDGVHRVLEAYKSRMLDLTRDHRFHYILIFKNHGPLAGATLMHAHSQIVALPVVPMVVFQQLEMARRYAEFRERGLFEDLLRQEERDRDRIVHENSGFIVFCPYASRVPFEMMILPKRAEPHYTSADTGELLQLADALKTALVRLRHSLDGPSYNLVLRSAPIRCSARDRLTHLHEDYRWHIEIMPRLGHLAGFEMGTGFFINSVLPEEAARHMRSVHTGE